MRTVKFVATLVLGYTLGEFFTQYRLQKAPIRSFSEYAKYYVAVQKEGVKTAAGVGMNLGSDSVIDRDLGKLQAKQLLFPNS